MNAPTTPSDPAKSTSILALAIYAAGALVAFYLSWSCNSHWNRGTLAKLVFAFISALSSWSYVLIYFLFKRGLCNPAAFCRTIGVSG